MFNRSARDNVAYGRPGASTAEIVAAARRARAHEFILDLVDHNGRSGYDAHLGERGVKTQRRPAPAHRPGARNIEGCTDSGSRRSHQRAGQRGRGRNPGRSGRGDERQNRRGHRPPSVDDCAYGPDRGAGSGPHRGGRHPCGADCARRALCAVLESPVGRLHRVDRGRGIVWFWPN